MNRSDPSENWRNVAPVRSSDVESGIIGEEGSSKSGSDDDEGSKLPNPPTVKLPKSS